jgi:hypothetical protein
LLSNNVENWPQALLSLYKMYATIDMNVHGTTTEITFFPRRTERTVENFLNAFTVIYGILSRVAGMSLEQEKFDKFWDDCQAYLDKLHYTDSIYMYQGSDFQSSAMNFWRREYSAEQEGLDAMFKMFKNCFGIRGNDDLCRYERAGVESYSWNTMRKLLAETLEGSIYVELERRDPKDYEWREESKQIIKDAIAKGREALREEDND